MNKEIKTKWVEALRSGKYKQGFAMLRNNYSYCCLGVLCDLYLEQTGYGGWHKEENSTEYIFNTKNLSSSKVLPSNVVDWAEISSQSNLAVINDRQVPFNEIADIIEEQF